MSLSLVGRGWLGWVHILCFVTAVIVSVIESHTVATVLGLPQGGPSALESQVIHGIHHGRLSCSSTFRDLTVTLIFDAKGCLGIVKRMRIVAPSFRTTYNHVLLG